jgi:YHS domain-containing protein
MAQMQNIGNKTRQVEVDSLRQFDGIMCERKTMISRTLTFIVVASAILGGTWMLGGCEKKQPTPTTPPKATVTTALATTEPNKAAAVSEATEQTMCPVMGSPIDKSIFVEYKGKKVYFCCSMCPPEFQKNPEKYISKLPQFKNP